MGRRRLIWFVVLFAIVAALTVWLEPTRVAWGCLRGEAFYQGRPTSYWAERIRPWELNNHQRDLRLPDMSAMPRRAFPRRPSAFQEPRREHFELHVPLTPHDGAIRKLVQPWLQLPEIPWPAVLDGDPDAESVLIELLRHPQRGVRDWAERGLRRIQNGDSGPLLRIRTGELPI